MALTIGEGVTVGAGVAAGNILYDITYLVVAGGGQGGTNQG